MPRAYIAAAALALFECAALAQKPAQATLTVAVTDQTGAVIPGAHLVTTNGATGAQFEAKTDANGEARVTVAAGAYDLRVGAQGFESWSEKEIDVMGEMRRGVTLRVAPAFSGPVVADPPYMPLDTQPFAEEIPPIPMELLSPPSKRPRRKARWF